MPDAVKARLGPIAYHVPPRRVTNEDLAGAFPGWSAEKIEQKTGIRERHVVEDGQCSSDLAVAAARALFEAGACRPEEIDYLLLCTQSPDHFLPTTACLLQDRLGIPTSAGALDFNLGCSGYVYGLSLAKGLVETRQARRVLLLVAETYSRLLNPRDRSVRTLFGDAAAATLVEAVPVPEGGADPIGPFVFGTDGRGGPNLIVPAGGFRRPHDAEADLESQDAQGSWRAPRDLHMDGAEIFDFTVRTIPGCVGRLLESAGLSLEDVDLFVFHQANAYLLEHLRRKLAIPREKFVVALAEFGNTVSATIPIALREAERGGQLRPGMRVALVGFGVGYSWGACLVRWAA